MAIPRVDFLGTDMAKRRRSFKGVFERLLRFLTALGCEIEIKIAAAAASSRIN
jgi:hypothetical protein